MSDYNYDASICRNIMVDIRYVLFILDKYGDCGHLVKEMKLVHPKADVKPTQVTPKRLQSQSRQKNINFLVIKQKQRLSENFGQPR
jgi:hypothetical protein